MPVEDVAARIRRARQRRRWTQAEAAERMGVSVRTIGDWERGTKTPRNLTIVEDVLGISLTENGTEPDPREEELRELVTGVLPDGEVEQWIMQYRNAARRKPRAG